jgi:hypothetical protein
LRAEALHGNAGKNKLTAVFEGKRGEHFSVEAAISLADSVTTSLP